MNISCRIANADTQCGRITNPPERDGTVVQTMNYYPFGENKLRKEHGLNKRVVY